MSYVPGPTYDEMRDPTLLPESLRRAAAHALKNDELNPLNLFNIHWMRPDAHDTPRSFVVPAALTNTDANIVVLVGNGYPSGSHKVGAAYSTLAEDEADGKVDQSQRIVGPSTGNFGIGTAYIANLKGYQGLVVMPDSMSKERYERIKGYGGELLLTPGTESDVILVLEKVHHELMKDPRNHVLAQFELLPNYRFHRHVSGHAAEVACRGLGDGRVAAYAWAPGSAGSMALADHLKTLYDEFECVALEPEECSTLTDGGRGQHRIEGIGDKMITLIHNAITTDYLATIHDDDTVKGLYVLHNGRNVLKRRLGLDDATCDALASTFGVSGVCMLLGSIRTAKKLGLKKGQNVVTMATDGFDRYPSVMRDLEERMGGEITEATMEQWLDEIFLETEPKNFTDVRAADQKERLFKQKEDDWLKFGYPQELLDNMRSQDWWEAEYEKVHHYNESIAKLRDQHGGLPSA